ncbi:MAG: response regulator [Ferruginibacter sp.]
MKYILALDDSTHILEAFDLILRLQGYEFKGESTDKDFFETLQQRLPDIILLDIQIGNLNGKEICKKIKAMEGSCHIPIILVSAHSSQLGDYDECGADAVLAKPFDLTALLEVIKKFTGTLPTDGPTA